MPSNTRPHNFKPIAAGSRFGSLSVLSFSHIGPSGGAFWLCRCDCGNEKAISRRGLVTGDVKTCTKCWHSPPKHLPDGSIVTCQGWMFSAEDADLAQSSWASNNGYAMRTPGGKKSLLAHRVVLERMLGRKLVAREICDHINGDVFDNRRSNLRLTNHLGNAQNTSARNGTSSGVRGVTWHKKCQKWQVTTKRHERCVYGGLFVNLDDARLAAEALRCSLGFLGRERG